MKSRQVVRLYWDLVQARNWDELRDILHDSVVVDWPASGEQFTGAENVVALNRDYPEGWTIRVLGILSDGDRVASEVEVPMAGVGTFRVASFWVVRDGKIQRGTEYWTELGQDDAPEWRRSLSDSVLDTPIG